MRQWVFAHKLVLVLFVLAVLQLLFITKLPVFNDEGIYLDWAWRETHVPGFLFYSLYDAKQPLLMWLFGIAESLLKDPLFAGRLVSVLVSLISCGGVYKVAKELTDWKYALLAVVLFSLTPLIFFYNRQALMESSMICVGIWVSYLTMKLEDSSTLRYASWLGVVVGFGYFIKSTTLIFLIASVLVGLAYRLKQRQVTIFLKQYGVVLGVALCVVALLLIQPEFWSTLGSNNRYILTLPEMFHLGITSWLAKIVDTTRLLFLGLTPFVFIFGLCGLYFFMRQKERSMRVLFYYFMICIFLEFLIVRSVNSRYLVPFLGLSPVFAVYALFSLKQRCSKKVYSASIFFTLLPPLLLSGILWLSPRMYLESMPFQENRAYLYGQTAGYGIPETVAYLKEQIKGKEAAVGVGLQSGNPESSVIMYFEKDRLVHGSYFDTKQMGDLTAYDCMSARYPVYFISREEQLVGLDRFLTKVKTINQEGSRYTIGIYTLKSPCQGKTLQLTEIKT